MEFLAKTKPAIPEGPRGYKTHQQWKRSKGSATLFEGVHRDGETIAFRKDDLPEDQAARGCNRRGCLCCP